MSRLLDFSIGITRSWAATYTSGLPHDTRAERREEIDSDLWDHKHLADIERDPASGTAAQILARVALGIPADLLWRIEAGSSTQLTRSISVNDKWYMRVGLVVATLPLLLIAVLGIGVIFGIGDWEGDSQLEKTFWGLVFAVCPAVSIVGLWLSRARPKLGIWLVVGGWGAMAVVMFWAAIIIVPVGLAVTAFAIKRSGLGIWPFRASPTGPTGTA